MNLSFLTICKVLGSCQVNILLCHVNDVSVKSQNADDILVTQNWVSKVECENIDEVGRLVVVFGIVENFRGRNRPFSSPKVVPRRRVFPAITVQRR